MAIVLDGLDGLGGGGTKLDTTTFRLRLNGHEFSDLLPERTGIDEISFDLAGLRDDKVGWARLADGPPILGVKIVTVAIAHRAGPDLTDKSGKPAFVRFKVFSATRLLVGLLAAIAIVAFVSRLGATTNLLRDPGLQKSSDRPYSLARCQMAFWFLIVTTLFIGIWLITGNYDNIITTQSIALLGISGATALAAEAIDAMKSEAVKRSPDGPPVHETFWSDLLTDDTGWVFHRIQILVWTVLLGAVSVWSAYDTLELPNFDSNLLALMGLSSGLYLGFKWPEQQTGASLPSS